MSHLFHPFNAKWVLFLSLGASFLLHLFLFQNCTIIFPMSSETFKPKFSFLGSIIPENELLFSEKIEKDIASPKLFPKSFESQLNEKGGSAFSQGILTKPRPVLSEKENKIVLKSTFRLREENASPKRSDVLEDLPGPVPYKPLRLYRK